MLYDKKIIALQRLEFINLDMNHKYFGWILEICREKFTLNYVVQALQMKDVRFSLHLSYKNTFLKPGESLHPGHNNKVLSLCMWIFLILMVEDKARLK